MQNIETVKKKTNNKLINNKKTKISHVTAEKN